mgnify:FL=1
MLVWGRSVSILKPAGNRLMRGVRNGLAVVVALTLGLVAHAETIVGRVVKVADGDTITVLDDQLQQHRIRLAGIDAPEKKQDFGSRSRENLSRIVAGRTVVVESNKLDRYGRSVGVVLVDGRDANLAQVQAGMAWWYRAYAREQSVADQTAYASAEEGARTQHRGWWAISEQVAPWVWRRSTREAQ